MADNKDEAQNMVGGPAMVNPVDYGAGPQMSQQLQRFYGRPQFSAHPHRYSDYDQNEFRDPQFFQNNQSSRPDHSGKGPKGWKRSDEKIKDDVCELLASDPYVDASEIEVDVDDGVVYLSGEVDDRITKRHCEAVTDRVTGVVDVQNQLQFDREPQSNRTDSISPQAAS